MDDVIKDKVPGAEPKSGSGLLLMGIFISGFVALVFEVVWLRSLSYVIGNTTYAASTMLAAFMAGLAAGSYLGGRLADKYGRPLLSFGLVQVAIAVSGLLALLLIERSDVLYAFVFYRFHLSFPLLSIAQMLFSFLLMFIPTVFMGATFPIVLKAEFINLDGLGNSAGKVYSINTLGSVLGALTAGFILIPTFGIRYSNILAAAIELAFGLFILAISWKGARTMLVSLVLLALSASGLVSMVMASTNDRMRLNLYIADRYKSYDAFRKAHEKESLIYSSETAEGLTQVYESSQNGNRFLVRNGKIEGSLADDMANQVMLAYLPLACKPDALTFMNIGAGTGTTIYRALQAGNSLAGVDCIEIDEGVIKALDYFYPDLRSSGLVKFIKQDARNYLRYDETTYDIISSEPSYPMGQVENALMTEEFFKLAKGRLNEGGVFVQWVPYWILRKEGTPVIIKSFGRAFPAVQAWNMDSGDIILVGFTDVDEMPDRKTSESKLRKMLEPALRDSFRFGADVEKLKKIIESPKVETNTDDRPVIEFLATRLIPTSRLFWEAGD